VVHAVTLDEGPRLVRMPRRAPPATSSDREGRRGGLDEDDLDVGHTTMPATDHRAGRRWAVGRRYLSLDALAPLTC
jgi:hypothetical protein